MGRANAQTPLAANLGSQADPAADRQTPAPTSRSLGEPGPAAAAAVVDRDGRITEVNGPMVALASDDGGTLIGAPWKDRFGEAALA
ncbi:MAG: hypothetical protein QOE17_1215, partial [Gaiellales bacterium]|nr:hypothetical protein [Gaiellales bacterium]